MNAKEEVISLKAQLVRSKGHVAMVRDLLDKITLLRPDDEMKFLAKDGTEYSRPMYSVLAESMSSMVLHYQKIDEFIVSREREQSLTSDYEANEESLDDREEDDDAGVIPYPEKTIEMLLNSLTVDTKLIMIAPTYQRFLNKLPHGVLDRTTSREELSKGFIGYIYGKPLILNKRVHHRECWVMV